MGNLPKQGARRMASIGSLVDPTSPPACAASSVEARGHQCVICFPTIDPGQKPESVKLGKATDSTWQLLATLRLYQFFLPPPNLLLGAF